MEYVWCTFRRGNYHYGSLPLEEIAWYFTNSRGTLHPVGEKQPNNYGLYDMLGNVFEYTNDWYGENYYSHSPLKNPTGPKTGTRRVVRGGSFMHEPIYLRCGHRNNFDPQERNLRLGARLALPEI